MPKIFLQYVTPICGIPQYHKNYGVIKFTAGLIDTLKLYSKPFYSLCKIFIGLNIPSLKIYIVLTALKGYNVEQLKYSKSFCVIIIYSS